MRADWGLDSASSAFAGKKLPHIDSLVCGEIAFESQQRTWGHLDTMYWNELSPKGIRSVFYSCFFPQVQLESNNYSFGKRLLNVYPTDKGQIEPMVKPSALIFTLG
jgi:hypothetical protein